MDYDEYYKNNPDVFGHEPEKILLEFTGLIPGDGTVLDLGAGQGRNAVFLARSGFLVDAVDTSSVSIQFLEKIGNNENMKINPVRSGIKDFTGKSKYSAILLFGLMQILELNEIKILNRKIVGWMNNKSILFITAFTVADPGFAKISADSQKIGKNSFLRPSGEKRTFFEPGEIKNMFENYKCLYYREGLGPIHRHGNNPEERHNLVEAVFQQDK